MNSEESPRVGVGAVIKDDQDCILLVLRKKAPEAGYWSLPGARSNTWRPLKMRLSAR
ncbi:hypothetical protein RE628_06950 [Paenibacillus sp. D2_2]|uniref:hypothetical protein n=1 Tax=Paenibacillus sp. D2_2 TaxID=3073092 RepID=UPI002814BEF5|nr:hypothetical protein [Paenibacillus sp. D2_2]WMT42153.1 hypothetical protein RE628_06950 [Paenibacillus sp. D2_2]